MKDLSHEVLLHAIVSQNTTAGICDGYKIAKQAYKLGRGVPKDTDDLEAEIIYLRGLVRRLSGLRDPNPIGHGVIVTSGGELDVEKLLDRIASIEHRVSRTIDDGR